jgi:phosphoribosylanthranilate isomerase
MSHEMARFDQVRTRLKICCIASRDEAAQAVSCGADAIGLVSSMPSGPGVIDDTVVTAVASQVPVPVETFLLTSRTEASALIAQAATSGVRTLQLVDAVTPATLAEVRAAVFGVRLVQVIHVLDDASVTEAMDSLPHVDALLLDSGNPRLPIKELGGTGRVHDWSLSRRIRDAAHARRVPVFLAGGLRPDNLREAIGSVAPFGVDVCSGVRTDGRLDRDKLAGFVAALAEADRSHR